MNIIPIMLKDLSEHRRHIAWFLLDTTRSPNNMSGKMTIAALELFGERV